MIWNIEHFIAIAVASLIVGGLGYLWAKLNSAKNITGLEGLLAQARSEVSARDGQLREAQQDVSSLRDSKHLKEQEIIRFEEKLNAATQTEAHLNKLLDEKKQQHDVLSGKLDEINQQCRDAEKLLESAQARTKAQEEQINEIRASLVKSQSALEAKQVEMTDLQASHTRLKTEQQEREASHAREVATFEKQKESLSEHFKTLSSEILETKAKSLQESSKLTLSSVMNPFQQSIDNFKKEVQDIHHRETTQQGELRKELESLKALNQQITQEAHELSTALRGQKKLQGNWGELVLENVLDRSGLQLGKDYKREVSITTEEGRHRPDAIVYLPQEKHLIIDAKVSLNAYTRYVNSEDEQERAIALKEHVEAVASRIRELADRDYYKLPGLNSPEMVFMFIPIESAFVEALKGDESLFQKAIENNVLVATPTPLLTSLNIVRQLWRYEDQNKHTAALANKAESVFKKLNSFLASFEKLKKSLDAATDAYSKAEGQLLSGRGNLVKQVGEFKNLAPAIKAELPSYFVEKAALEVDFIPVSAEKEQAPEPQEESASVEPE